MTQGNGRSQVFFYLEGLLCLQVFFYVLQMFPCLERVVVKLSLNKSLCCDVPGSRAPGLRFCTG